MPEGMINLLRNVILMIFSFDVIRIFDNVTSRAKARSNYNSIKYCLHLSNLFHCELPANLFQAALLQFLVLPIFGVLKQVCKTS